MVYCFILSGLVSMALDTTDSYFKRGLLQKPNNIHDFAETHETYEKIKTDVRADLAEDLENTDDAGITLALGGGTIFTFATYEIVQDLVDSGIPIKEVIGNSWGSLVGTLLATGNLSRENVEALFSSIKLTPATLHLIPTIVMAGMMPFVCDFTYQGQSIDIKDFLVAHRDELFEILRPHDKLQKGIIPDTLIRQAAAAVLQRNGYFPEASPEEVYRDLGARQITFNDIKTRSGVGLKVMSSVLKVKSPLSFSATANTLKKFRDSPNQENSAANTSRQDIKKALTKDAHQSRERIKFFREGVVGVLKIPMTGTSYFQDVTYQGDFKVLPALLVSTFFAPQVIRIGDEKVLAADGRDSGNEFPYSNSHFAGEMNQNPVVLVHAPGIWNVEENKKDMAAQEAGKKEFPFLERISYGNKIRYVIAPPFDSYPFVKEEPKDTLLTHLKDTFVPPVKNKAPETDYTAHLNSDFIPLAKKVARDMIDDTRPEDI